MFFNSTFSGTVYNFGETKKNPDKVRQKYLNAFFGPTAIGTSIFRAIRCQFHQHFLHAFFVQKYFLCLEFGFEQTFVQKMRAKNVDEIDDRFQFHLNFTCAFSVQKQISLVTFGFVIFWRQNFACVKR